MYKKGSILTGTILLCTRKVAWMEHAFSLLTDMVKESTYLNAPYQRKTWCGVLSHLLSSSLLYAFVLTCPGLQESKEISTRVPLNCNQACMYHCKPVTATAIICKNHVHLDKSVRTTTTKAYKSRCVYISRDPPYNVFPLFSVLRCVLPCTIMLITDYLHLIFLSVKVCMRSVRVCTSMYWYAPVWMACWSAIDYEIPK